MKFKNKVVVVTGASRGIGHSIADAFASHGATVAICSTNHEKATEVAASLKQKYGHDSYGEGVDIKDFAAVSEFISNVHKAFGRIDILINNAGITRDNLLLRLTENDWTDVINTNLNSIFYTTKSVIKIMLKQKYGRIVNISSVVGLMGNPGQSNYCASKAGMLAFTKSISKEYGKKNITVNAVAPGFIETDMTDSLPNEHLDNIIGTVPLNRIGTPDDVSNAVMFLASDDASYMTGQVLSVDGGLYM